MRLLNYSYSTQSDARAQKLFPNMSPSLTRNDINIDLSAKITNIVSSGICMSYPPKFHVFHTYIGAKIYGGIQIPLTMSQRPTRAGVK